MTKPKPVTRRYQVTFEIDIDRPRREHRTASIATEIDMAVAEYVGYPEGMTVRVIEPKEAQRGQR